MVGKERQREFIGPLMCTRCWAVLLLCHARKWAPQSPSLAVGGKWPNTALFDKRLSSWKGPSSEPRASGSSLGLAVIVPATWLGTAGLGFKPVSRGQASPFVVRTTLFRSGLLPALPPA